ncbi:MAG: hypothetical protein IIC84_00310 [Chloroflexi bacterium]|nr:hypothetical protein [Chloroflexota bacterium]
MRKKSFIYSGILIVALVILSVLVNQGVVQGLASNTDVNLGLTDPPPSSQYLLGQTIRFNGSLDFTDGEEILLHGVRLRTTNGPQGLNVFLPVSEGTHDISSLTAATEDTLIVTVSYNNITFGGAGGSTLPGGTIPGSTIPGGGEFTGTGVGASINYDIEWTPGVMLDPPPVFTLIPSIEELFSIPVIPTPIPPDPADVLPNTTVQYAIPVVGAPAGTPLPNTEAAWGASGDIPQVTVSTNAPVGLPDLPNTNYTDDGFDIPNLVSLGLVPTPPSGVGSFPITTAGFDVPDLSSLGLVPTPPAGDLTYRLPPWHLPFLAAQRREA